MSDKEIAEWIASVELDLANVASADDCWRLRELAARHVHESRKKDPC